MKPLTKIESIRAKLNLTRAELAKLLGVTYTAVCQYEIGVRRPRLKTCYLLIEVAKKHGLIITLDDILVKF